MGFEDRARAGDDERYMREALREAAKAAEEGEVPVGAVIVKDGKVIAREHNRVEATGMSAAHAELLAIQEAEKVTGSKWLNGAVMYVTLEPCSMCAGAMVLSRLSRLVFGADDPKTGACGSLYNIADDKRLNHRIEVERGVLGVQCSELLTGFFKKKRAQ